MKIKDLQAFLDENATGIQIPEADDDLYTRYFVTTTGFPWDWTLCQTVHDLTELLELADSQEFDDDDYDIEPSMTIYSIGLSQNQYAVFQAFFAEKECNGWL